MHSFWGILVWVPMNIYVSEYCNLYKAGANPGESFKQIQDMNQDQNDS